MLPGLVALAQSWLDDVALSSFRRSSTKAADLDTWFANPQVTLYLKVTCRPSLVPLHRFTSLPIIARLYPILAGPVLGARVMVIEYSAAGDRLPMTLRRV